MNKNPLPIPTPIAPVPKKPIPPPPKTQRSNLISLDKGKMPPQAIELEEALLGAILIDTRAIVEVVDIIEENFFYKEIHQFIYRAIKNLYDENIGIDLLTVSIELKRIGKLAIIGGDYYLIHLTQNISSAAHIEFHARIIIQKYVLRQLIKISSETIENSYVNNPDIFYLMDNIEFQIAKIYKHAIQNDDVVENIDPIQTLRNKVKSVRDGNSPGIALGISEFDEWSGGVQERELITIAGRTGMGKTSATLAIAGNIAIDKDTEVAFFSLEMSKLDLLYRLAARLSGVSYNTIRQGKSSDDELNRVEEALKYLLTSKLQVYDASFHKNIYEKIEAKIRELAKKGVKIFMIDYVQLVKLLHKSSDRTADLSTITRQLKGLCNELNITIIMLAQVGRGTDSRSGSKIPLLSDLKQSGSIEEDSDMVIFLVRDAYYREKENSGVVLPPHILSRTDFIIAKGRSTGTRDFVTYLDFLTYKICSYGDY